MINTTLCYLQRGEEYLMLHRVKKENDLNQDKWIGVGGKFEDKEDKLVEAVLNGRHLKGGPMGGELSYSE